MWDKITVGQFQAIYKISIDKEADEMEKVSGIISILYNKTLAQVDEMSIVDFNKLASRCTAFLNIENIPGRPVKYLKAGGKRYFINYDASKLKHRQYVEVQHFGGNPIENMHLILASIVQPVRFFIKVKNRADMHKKIANDLLGARMVDVYHSCVFFCKVYQSSIQSLLPYLELQLKNKGLKKKETKALLTYLQNDLGGFIPQGR